MSDLIERLGALLSGNTSRTFPSWQAHMDFLALAASQQAILA